MPDKFRQAATRLAMMLLAGAALPAAAIAQLQDLGPAKSLSSAQQAQQVRRGLEIGAACLVDQRPQNVSHFLRLFPESKDAARAVGYLDEEDCVEGAAGPIDLHFSPTIMRGALYKALYVRDFTEHAPTISTPAPVYATVVAGQDQAKVQDFLAARHFADCVVHKEPASSRALVLADAESAAEMTALGHLVAAEDQCRAQQSDAPPPLPRAALTGVIAETLYLLSAPKSAA